MQVGLTTLLLALLAGWLILRVTRNPEGNERDPAAMVRRLFLYGLLYATVVLAAQGVIELAREILDADRRSNTALARAMSFLIVGIPITALLGRYIDRRLAAAVDERRALAWTVYLNAILATALFGFLIEGHAALHAALAPASERDFEASNLVAAIVWGGVWAVHWFGFRRRHGITGDLDLAVGTIIGLVPVAVGLGGVVYIGADEIYNAVTNDPETSRAEPTLAYLSALAVVGAVVWSWYWLGQYRRAHRTEIWYVTVVPIGALAGFVATIVGLAAAINVVGVWYVGDPDATTAVRHFDSLPVLIGVAAAGLLGWLYHRWELGPDPERGTAIQVYDYLLAFAALVASVVGVATLLVALFDDGPGSVANTAVAGATTVIVAGPVWAWFWSRIGRFVRAEPSRELASPVRRVYLFSLFGLGGLLVLVSGLAVLFTTIEDALDGTLSRQTLHDNRVGLAVLLTVTGVAWYHFQIYRSERPDDALSQSEQPDQRRTGRHVQPLEDSRTISDPSIAVPEGTTPSILVAVDPASPPPRSAAIDTLALATGWPLVLVNAVPHDSSADAVDDANKGLAELAETFAEGGIDARTCTLVGPPVDVIMAEAEAVRAAVIVMGGRRDHLDGRPAIGSVTSALLKVADRPVLVLPTGARPSQPGFVAAVERLIDLIDRNDEADRLAELRYAAARLPSEPTEANRHRLDRRLRNTLHQFETEHPSLTAAVNDVAYYLSGMGI